MYRQVFGHISHLIKSDELMTHHQEEGNRKTMYNKYLYYGEITFKCLTITHI